MKLESKIYIAGHNGLVGSAIKSKLINNGYNNIIVRTHNELDLMNAEKVREFFKKERPDYVFLAAAKVGGILANSEYPVEFLYNNLQIQNNVIHSSWEFGVKKLLFLGSTCIYPRMCPQPMKESYLLTSELEPTNEAYAIAKIAGLKLCESFNKQHGTNFVSVMPTNLYGINDNFDLKSSHVLPALMVKIIDAKKNNTDVEIWGDGSPIREFLFVDDMAQACVFIMETINSEDMPHSFVNIGSSEVVSIAELAEIIKEVVGFKGDFIFGSDTLNGTPIKMTDTSVLSELGWENSMKLKDGIEYIYKNRSWE